MPVKVFMRKLPEGLRLGGLTTLLRVIIIFYDKSKDQVAAEVVGVVAV